MNKIQKRFLMFLIGCIGARFLLAFTAKKINRKYLPIMGLLALGPAIGFLYIYFIKPRDTGLEVQGGRIWWNFMRPLHALFYLTFAFLAIKKNDNAWIALLLDVLIGLIAFLNYHYKEGNFSKLF